MPFHRHSATPATANNAQLLQQQTMTAPIPLQTGLSYATVQPGAMVPVQQTTIVQTTRGYSAGAPLVQAPLVQAPLLQQQPIILTKEFSTTGISTQMASTSLNAGVSTTRIVKPAIIDETVRTDTFIEVQPILHREIDQQRIHHVEQHITERAAPSMGGTVKLAPIVQETVLTNVIEEVQPIIHREVATRSVERVEEHLTERVAAPVVHTAGLPLGLGQAQSTISKPAIIDERIRTDRLVQVQPILHREIEQPRIHHVEQHITERAAPAMGGTVKLAPIVQETVLTNVIEEVQPIIHREVATRSVERVEEHLTERVAAPVVHTAGLPLGLGQAQSTISKPAIIDERIRTDRLVQVQPILHREIEQPRIHHVEQHITERAAPAMGGTVKLAPIVQETVRTNVIEEVQPVIHRERAVQQVQRVEEHLNERVAAPVVHTAGVALGAGQATSTIARPAIIDERVRTDKLVEIQPVVHREIEQQRVHHVERHISEAPAPSMGGVVKMAPVVQQTIRTNVIEEVQPVIHREIATRSVERVEEHVTERIVAPTQHTREVVQSTSTVGVNTLPLNQGVTINTLPLTQGLNNNLALNQGVAVSGLPLTQGLNSGLAMNQGAAISGLPLTQGLNNNSANQNFQMALEDRELALREKAALKNKPVAPQAGFAAGGPIPANANLARPL
eukprot:TRINITY_DN53_c0_g1_i16.p1 TRINITY_DN53_c0_g1~~TRINITY_DN53_c0_g1_i16.p1  ORF type:complete len:676 (-),score=260.98 TRINITY_DN53_c0_g1_i16:52-2079(-)